MGQPLMQPDAPGRHRFVAPNPRSWRSGPWHEDQDQRGNWLTRFRRWLLRPRPNRRRQVIDLLLLFGGSVVSLGFGAWALSRSHWLAAAWLLLGTVGFALGTGEDLLTLDLQGLNVPKDMKPAEVAHMTPPRSVWHRAAMRVVRIHRAERLMALGLWLLAVAVFASGQ